MLVDCNECDGQGEHCIARGYRETIYRRCQECNGRGRIEADETEEDE